MSDDAFHNQPIGGIGGTPWGDQLSHNNQKVRSISAWWGPEDGADFTVLKGLQLGWDDGVYRHVGHQEDYLQQRHFVFNDGEDIDEMVIHGAYNDPPGRADALEFSTTQGNNFFAGGPGGYPGRQTIGTGVLYGFDGAADADIDSLGAIVQED
ncbi:uncharacterized protein KD926_002155 [Aspergillus affinis]|uniref:uncharacterized protein n=1 Tax=Aspergillus affinis TaxID=1070780 RepID=UPI0022FE1F7C|nr:uncharacterized protein KD926_002155 [Aspergillus affinis]KAI9036246.1 hypothetical protein KD926_002155 [Aspergillus affinis]